MAVLRLSRLAPDAPWSVAIGVTVGTYLLIKGIDWQRKRRIESKLDQVLETVGD